MKESYGEDLANYTGLNPYAEGGNILGVASVRGTSRPAHPEGTRLRNHDFRASTLWCQREGHISVRVKGEHTLGTAESQNLCMLEKFQRENREILTVSIVPCGRSVRYGGTVSQHLRWNC